jgi:hypothetical protein
MAIQTMQLDPNAASYTDNEIVGKVNTATTNITRAGCIEGTAASALDSDDIGEGTTNKYDTGVPPADLDALTDGTTYKKITATEQTKLTGIEDNATADQTGDEMVTAINSGSTGITRESALSQDDLNIVKTNPVATEFKVKNIHRGADGKLQAEYDDVAV